MSQKQKNLLDLLQHFKTSGYQVDISLQDKNLLPITLKFEDDRILLKHNDVIICDITAKESVDGSGKVVIHLKDNEVDILDNLMNEAREIMLNERL